MCLYTYISDIWMDVVEVAGDVGDGDAVEWGKSRQAENRVIRVLIRARDKTISWQYSTHDINNTTVIQCLTSKQTQSACFHFIFPSTSQWFLSICECHRKCGNFLSTDFSPFRCCHFRSVLSVCHNCGDVNFAFHWFTSAANNNYNFSMLCVFFQVLLVGVVLFCFLLLFDALTHAGVPCRAVSRNRIEASARSAQITHMISNWGTQF